MDVNICDEESITHAKKIPVEIPSEFHKSIPSTGNMRSESNPSISAPRFDHPARIRLAVQSDLPERLARSASDFIKNSNQTVSSSRSAPLKARSKRTPPRDTTAPYLHRSPRILRPRSSNQKPKLSSDVAARRKMMKKKV